MTDKAHKKGSVKATVSKLLLVVVVMFSFVFVVMVPLYNVLCDVLGINGKTSGRYEAVEAEVDTDRTIKVQFVARNNDAMPWGFAPAAKVLRVHPGELHSTAFIASNPAAQDMVGQAIPSIVPARAAAYFNKTECFCFNQQPLKAGEQADLPLQFVIDQALPADIHTITLSYTLFDVSERVAVAN
jgi:cytochrome c oxidase assembly protein subunit 11